MMKYTLKFDKHDPRDYKFTATRYTLDTLPESVDLRDKMPPIYNQLNLGSCSSQASCAFREYFNIRDNGSSESLSRLFLYWHERNFEGTVNEDSGAMLRDAMRVMSEIGICPESDFPYDVNTFTIKPSDKAEQDAPKYKISEYHRVNDFADMQHSLAEGQPVIIGIKVYESFESEEAARTGIVPMPKDGERYLGNHALLAVGYKTLEDGQQYAIIRNSWGNWGQSGYCFIPKSFFDSGFVVDLWTGKV